MRILAIDPGPVKSAFVWLTQTDGLPTIGKRAHIGNAAVLAEIWAMASPAYTLIVEMVECFGMPVGRSVFDTCVQVGRFLEAWRAGQADVAYLVEPIKDAPPPGYGLIYRRQVKHHLCNAVAGVTDSNIRQALIDKWGGKETAIGRKPKSKKDTASPGPLYGIKADVWQALAVGVTYLETRDG